LGLRRGLLELCRLRFGDTLFGFRLLQRSVERRPGILRGGTRPEERAEDQCKRKTTHASPFAMIGVVRKDRGRAEQLLGKHRTYQQVRPRRWTKGQQQVGRAALLLVMPVSSADQKTGFALAPVAPGLQLLRQV